MIGDGMEYIVNTPCGALRGIEVSDSIVAYKGIRYATAGRFEYPTEVTEWEGVLDATHYGACCYQPRSFYDEEKNKKKYFYYNEFRKGEKYEYSEDCLFLNVFAPKSHAEKLPVIVHMHGGGFTGGCGHEKHFDVPVWPDHGVIGVTINYRLGPLGFMVLPELHEEAGKSGNYGLYDQLTAIKWVRNNISAFGGDPDNITITGQSAGAMSVQQHCLSPLTKGLFKRAVMCSGGGVTRMLATKPEADGYAFWKMIMEKCGVTTLAELRALQAAEKDIRLWAGVELDTLALPPVVELARKQTDYILCSSHYVEEAGRWAAVDGPVERLDAMLNEVYHGDGLALARRFFEIASEGFCRVKPDIIGHFDLVRKYAQRLGMFDENDPAYRRMALSALEKTFACGGVLEVNTGGIARNYLPTPYPTLELLCVWREMGGKVTITSDCHDYRNLTCAFDQAEELLRKAGFRTVQRLGAGEALWDEVEL